MTANEKRITIAINTCSHWWSDKGSGKGLLSLGTSHIVHSEDHRRQCLSDIDGSIAWNETWTGTPDEVNDPKRDIPLLKDLRELVVAAKLGEKWMSLEAYNCNVEILYQKKEL